jgi:hypothetical protein
MRTNIRLGSTLLRELGKIAANSGRKVSELAEETLRQFVRSHRETAHLTSTKSNLRRLRFAQAEIESVKNTSSMKTAQAHRAARRLTPYQAAVKVGLVGCAAGPRDLAANRRKYLRKRNSAKRLRSSETKRAS